MHVAAILKEKGRAVETARPNVTLADIAKKLTVKRIGSIVITDDAGSIVGIVSERDVIHALAMGGQDSLGWHVSKVMTRQVVTCDEADTIERLMGMMTSRRFRHLPVVTDGNLAGIVSIGDVVKRHIAEVEMEATAMRDYITAS